MKTVVILGATPRTDRYPFLTMQRLQHSGYKAIPVTPEFEEILGERCYPSISEIPEPIDTVTIYLDKAKSTPLIDEILKAKPRRIIFNPGCENAALAKAAFSAGIKTVNDCTFVMLGAGSF
jgi:predicted CoA-binding protein